jgi:hypothetical protein
LQYYYLTLPLMGLAAFAAYALWRGWSRGGLMRLVAAALAAEFILVSAPLAWKLTRERYQWTQDARQVLSQVAAVSRGHPGKVILLSGVDDTMFQRVIGNNPFPLVGAQRVYLVPEARAQITPVPGINLDDFTLPVAPTRADFEQQRFVVLAVNRGMEDITGVWARTGVSRPGLLPRKVDAANDLSASLLGPGWYNSEQTHRWMGKRASLRIGAPAREGAKLVLNAGCAPAQVQQGPLRIGVSVEGLPLPAASVASCGGENFELAFDLPPGLTQKSWLEVVVEVDRTYHAPGDERELGLAFGKFEVR